MKNGVSSRIFEDSISINVVSKSNHVSIGDVYIFCFYVCISTGVSVFLTEPQSREVGISSILTCTVTLSHRARDSSLFIQWQGPSTGQQRNINLAQDTLFINELTLDPLTLADGGNYTCTSHYTAGGHTATVRSSVEQIIPISESRHCGEHSLIFSNACSTQPISAVEK